MLEFYGSHLWRCNLDVIPFLERLAESLRTIPSSPGVQSAVFLCFRVILIRMSPQHVTSLWPLIITEMVLIFSYLEQELSTDSEEWRWVHHIYYSNSKYVKPFETTYSNQFHIKYYLTFQRTLLSSSTNIKSDERKIIRYWFTMNVHTFLLVIFL